MWEVDKNLSSYINEVGICKTFTSYNAEWTSQFMIICAKYKDIIYRWISRIQKRDQRFLKSLVVKNIRFKPFEKVFREREREVTLTFESWASVWPGPHWNPWQMDQKIRLCWSAGQRLNLTNDSEVFSQTSPHP